MKTGFSKKHLIARLTALNFGLVSIFPAHAVLNIPDVPLQTNTSADPNIMMILDDSGSMHWEIMPDDLIKNSAYFVFPRADGIYGSSDYTNYAAGVEDSDVYNAVARSPQVNTVYYNPGITYLPWSKPDGSLYPNAVPSCALHHPMRSGTGESYCRNLTQQVSNYRENNVRWVSCTSSSSCSLTANTNLASRKTYWPATYFWKASSSTGVWSWSSYTKTVINSSTATYTGHGRENRSDCNNGTCTYNQEIQNFANWYTYYRSRTLTARAGVGRAFAAQDDGLRVGYGTINKGSTSIDGVSTGVIINGVRQFKGNDRTAFFTELYTRDNPASGTPLIGALNAAGKYYSRTDDKGPWSTTPGQNGGSDLACRQSYTILMTDGYYSDSISGIGNSDNTAGSQITGPNGQRYTYQPVAPFKDGNSNTLADVAMHYWKNDLRTDMTNSVPTSAKDPAFWQHMVTFGVGLGVQGSVNPDTAFAAIKTSADITWPSTGTNSGKLDDLLHAAVNGRGAFFSAQNPSEFAQALTAMLKDIVERKSSSASVAVSGARLSSSSKVFSPSFSTSGWTGELAGYSLALDGTTSLAWKASEKIPAHASRKIYTVTGGVKREFKWSNLSTDDRAALGSESIVNYLRGDQSKETKNGGTLRTRSSRLGDIVHSSPVYDPGTHTVYIGANDGMLHAFDAQTGTELFAYVPSAVIPNLKEYTQSAYQHRYYVDGELALVTKTESGLTKTYLVGSLGLGGKGVFALDVTNPASFTEENIVWEYTDNSDTELGSMMGKPVYAKLNTGDHAILLGNGYNSSSGKSALYVFKLIDGSLIRKFVPSTATDNGMATPGEVDLDSNGTIDRVYAGDLKGNVWKFDLKSSASSGWSESRFFVAMAADNTLQPITSKITSAVNYLIGDVNFEKRYIFFGTGSYFQYGDLNDKSVQSLYGLIDDGTAISGRTNLKQRSINTTTTLGGKPARVFQDAATDGNGKVTDMSGKKGWYLDWVVGNSKKGERVITSATSYRLTEPTLLVSSIIPEAEDPCQPGGTGYVNVINAFSGGSLKEAFFEGNLASGGIIGSLDLGIGMPSQASLTIGNDGKGQLIVGGSGDNSNNSKPFDTKQIKLPPKANRTFWHELSR